jgi:Co/Zn/Cd efflux system component
MAKTKGTQEWRQFWTDGRRTHTGHARGHDDHDPHEKLGAYGEKVLRWGLWSDIILTIAKVAAGYISGSTAIIADAAHSASDIVFNHYSA